MTTGAPNPPTTSSQFRRRLGYYLVGLAIGCVMIGLLQIARSRERAAEQAAEAAAAQGESAAPAPANAPNR